MISVTFLISTFNRRDVLLRTLAELRQCGLAAGWYETIVVDNASTDGTSAAVAAAHPDVYLIRLPTNRGPCAKNAGLAVARGQFIVFLDDDSFPADPASIPRMLEQFAADPSLGAAVFTVALPDGSRECSAYPNVCIGCGTGFRRTALDEVGGLPTDFFMAAEEYDLSLRLLDAGWKVEPFADLHVTHLKTPSSRFPSRVTRLDVRNNLLLIARHFPAEWAGPFARSWLKRYRLIAAAKGQPLAFWRGLAGGAVAAGRAWRGRRPVSHDTFERFARVGETERRLRDAVARHGSRRVVFVDLGKNILAYERAAKAAGVEVIAIADKFLGGRGFTWDGVPIVTDADALKLSADAAIVSNLSPVHAAARARQWRGYRRVPVIDLFGADEARTGERIAA